MKNKIVGFGLAGLCVMSAWAQGAPLLLDWGVLDTTSAAQQKVSQQVKTQPKAATVQRKSVRGTVPWLVQFNDVIQEEWKTAMVAAGAEIRGYMPENGFVVLATPAQIAAIGEWPEVVYVGEFLPAYKRSRAVRQLAAKAGGEMREYNVWTYRPEDAGSIAKEVAGLSGATVTRVAALPDRGLVRAILSIAAVDTATGWGEVEWVDPYLKRQLWNDVATRTDMMNVSNAWNSLGLTGSGQTIAVCDTGLDTGNTNTLHPDFTNRVTGFGWTNGSYSAGYSWADYDSHGTHVAGSVLGNGTLSTGKYRGVAYEADLIFQGANASLDGIPVNLTTLFKQAFDNGARIHSDSWGLDDDGYYSTDSRYVDMFTWSNRTMLILIAAGNAGIDANSDGVVDLDSIGSPATAKNCLTVGASENYRTTGGYSTYTWGAAWPSDYPANPINSDYLSRPDDSVSQGLAAFSSRGPCDDGRIKPDLVAPGTDIISTRTRRSSDTGWGTVTGNTNYLYMGGTSMATPLTAGAAGLAREWVTTTGGVADPSGALIKALLMNGARNMSPGQYGTGSTREISAVRPDNAQGWGHVDLYYTLQPATNEFLDLIDTNSLSTGQTNTFTYSVTTTTTNRFILTLAYSDYWASSGAGKKLVNDLDLTVVKPGGTTNYANGKTYLDATNNVEMIEFTADETGTYTVTVNARTVPSGGSQPYALVIRGPDADETPTAPVFGANPGPVSTTTGVAVAFTVTASGYPAPTLALQSQTASSGYSFVPATGVLTYTPPVSDVGTNTFTFTATNASGAATQTVSVVVYEAPPAAPASIWASTTNATDFMAAWSAVSGATSYRLDVSTNESFGGSGGGGGVQLGESFDSGLATSYTTGDQTLTSGVWNTVAVYQETATDSRGGTGHAARLNDDTAGAALRTPALNTVGAVTFWYRELNSGGGSFILQKSYDASAWVNVQTQTFSGNTYTLYSNDVDDAAATIYVRVLNDNQSGHLIVDDFEVTAMGSGTPDYVAGYSNRTVSGTSQSVTGLTAGAAYYFRARAVSGGGPSQNSATASVTTVSTPTAPVFGANPGPLATTTGVAIAFTVSATGSPTPVLALQSTTASSGYSFTSGTGQLDYTPPPADVGARTFTFTASNTSGVATQTVNVTVSAAANPPTVSFGEDRVVGEEGGASVSLPVNLSFAADATVQVAIAGTALPDGTDFSCSTTLVFSASATSNLIFTIENDSLPEGPETAQLTLNPVSGATLGTTTQAVLVVRDNDAFAVVAANLTSGGNQEYEYPGARILDTLAPDVVLIQEFNMTNGITHREWVDEHFGTNYEFYVETQGTDYIPNGVISRWPITASNEWYDSEVGNRDFAWATINLPGLRDLHVVSIHLKADAGYESTRTSQARALTNYIAQAGWPADDYLVVGGDLNLQNRSETALAVLTNVVSDARQPADQNGDKDTNSGRYNPYDLVLPNDLLDARHRSFSCYGYTFTNGLVFDTRLTWSSGLPPPALATDSDDTVPANTNMQHMAVLKIFEFESSLADPQAFTATAASQTQIDLTFTTNAAGDDVVIAWNSDGNFGTPTGTVPSVGSSLAGGTVLYTGSSSPQNHTGLSAYQTVYYKCWSVTGTNYSGGLTANATTDGLDAPASIWASATNSTGFTAAWSASAGATSYRLDASTNAEFEISSGGGGGVQLGESFDSGLATSYTTGDQTLTSGVWNTVAVYQETATDSRGGTGHAARLNDDTAGAALRTPALNTVGAVTFWYRELNSGGGSFVLQKSYDASAWVNVHTQTFSGNTYTLYSNDVNDAAATVYVRVLNDNQSGHLIVDDFEVTSYGSSTPDYVPGYSNRTVAGTSQSVTGLTAETTYYFRVRAVSGGGSSVNSSTGTVVTLGSGTPPVMDAIPPQVVGVGTDLLYTVTATEPDTNTVTFACTSIVDEATWVFDTDTGDFLFDPTATEVGTNIFTFRATDKDGTSAPVDMTVRVNSQAPTNAFEEWVEDQGHDPGDTNFYENADFDGDGATTDDEYRADTNPADSNSVLRLTGDYLTAGETGGGTGRIEFSFPASTGRYYQLETCIDLTNYTVSVSNLGWGLAPTMTVTSDAPATWYGVIRARLDDPGGP